MKKKVPPHSVRKALREKTLAVGRHHADCNCQDCRYDRASDPIPGWSDFCEAQGTRCTFTAKDFRCAEGVTKGDRCAKHQRPE